MAAGDFDNGRTRPRRLSRWAGGGIIRSSVETRYQLGLLRHAGSLMVPLRASTPRGDLRVAHERGLLGAQVARE